MTNLTTLTTGGSSTFLFDGTATLTSAGKTLNNLTIGTATVPGAVTLADNLTLTGAISVGAAAGSTFTVSNRTVTVGGNVTLTNLLPANFTSTGSTFVFDGTSTLTTNAGVFNNVQVGTATLGGSLVLADNLTLTGTLTFFTGGATTLNATGQTVTLPTSLNMTNLTTFTSTGSTFVFDGTATLTSAGKSFNNLTIGTATVPGAVTLADNLTLTGAISVGAAAGSTFTVTNRTVTVGGNVTLTNLLPANFTSTGSTFVFDGTSTLTSAGSTFNNLTIGTATVPGTLTLADNLTLTGAISVGAAAGSIFTVSNRTVTVAGNVTLTNLLPANFTSTGSTFIFNGTSTLTTNAGVFNNVQMGTATLGGSLTLADNLTLTGTLTFFTGGATTLNATGRTVTLPTSLDMTNLTTFTSTGSTFVFDGTATLTNAGKTFNNLAIGTATLIGALTLADNLTLTGAISVGAAAGSSFTVTNRTVTVAGNVTLTNLPPANFTITGSTFVFDGTTTLTSAGSKFNNFQVGTATLAGSVTLGDNAALANGNGTLSMTQGTLTLNGHTFVLGTALNMSSANTAQITIDTGTLDGTTNGRSITISSAQATITQTTGTMSATGFSIGAGAYTVTGVGTVTLGAGGFSQTGGVVTAGGALMTSSGTVAITAGTFTQGSSTVTMDTTGTTVQVVSPNQLNNLTIGVSGSGSVSTSTNDLSMTGALDIISGWTFDTNLLNLAVGSATITGTLVGSNSKTITVTGGWNRNGGTFTWNQSKVQFAGTGTVTGSSGTETFYDFVKSGAATNTTFTTNLVIVSSLTLSSGTLTDGGPFTITMGNQFGSPAIVIWDSSGGGTFSAGTGTVFFYNTQNLVKGSNSFYVFWTDTSSAGHAVTISFQQATTQTVNNNFHAVGTAGNPLTLMSAAQATLYSVPPPNDPLLTALGGGPPNWAQQWYISVPGAATIDFAIVQLSWASTASITPGPNCTDDGYNDNWFFVIPIIASWTIDKNNNGRIDTLRIQVKQGTQLATAFGGITVKVDGYGTISGAGNFGFPAGVANKDVFDVTLPEHGSEDTSATPTWQILSNTSLYGIVGGAFVQHNTATASFVYTASKGARPVITYTVAALNSTQAYIHFSELVYGDSTLSSSLGPSSFAYSGGAVTVQPVETSGPGAHAAIITFATPLAVNDILAGAQAIQAATGGIWGVAAAVDPAAFPNATFDTLLAANANRSMLNTTSTPTAPAHNISDVGIGFITPVLAEDQSITRDPSRGGIGLVTIFDGSQWLPPQNTFLEARILPGFPLGGHGHLVLGHQSARRVRFQQSLAAAGGNHAVAGEPQRRPGPFQRRHAGPGAHRDISRQWGASRLHHCGIRPGHQGWGAVPVHVPSQRRSGTRAALRLPRGPD